MKRFLFLGALAMSFTSFANQSKMENVEKVDLAEPCTITVCRMVNGNPKYTTHRVKLYGGMTCQQAVDLLDLKLNPMMEYPDIQFNKDFLEYNGEILEMYSAENFIKVDNIVLIP